ncbi:transglutaminase domain-containing protein [Aeromonas taiwanensis]|uniref:transglutaminase domain-containing protein n=1 Tax=Aeromonas taiwanensis TaxID=633417 RepID=UPI003CD0DCAA
MMTSTRSLLLLTLLLALPASAGQTYFHSSGGQLNVGWQDREGEEQQLTYRLEAGKLPPLIAYRPARMQEEVLQRLLQQGVAEFPGVQFSLSRPGMELQLKSRQPEQVNQAMSWLTRERGKLESEWLMQHYFQPFTAPDGASAIKQDHVRIALESRTELAPLADQLKRQGTTETEARQKTVEYILDFVQAIPYRLLDSQSGRSGKGFLSPRQVLEQNGGDCDSKVTLMAALLAQLFPELRQTMVFVPGHALLGVALPATPGAATLSRDGETYLLMEPTGPAQLPLGQLAPASRVLVDSGQLSVQPVLANQ